MARDLKLERRARRSPGGLTFDEVRRLAETNGFRWRLGRLQHAVLTHPGLVATIGVANPHPEKHVDHHYVRKLLQRIDELRDLADDNEH